MRKLSIVSLKYRYLELMQADTAVEKEYHNLVLKINQTVQKEPL